MKFRKVLAERGLGGQGDREEQWWSGAKGASGQIKRAGNASSKIAGAPLFWGGLRVDFGPLRDRTTWFTFLIIKRYLGAQDVVRCKIPWEFPSGEACRPNHAELRTEPRRILEKKTPGKRVKTTFYTEPWAEPLGEN